MKWIAAISVILAVCIFAISLTFYPGPHIDACGGLGGLWGYDYVDPELEADCETLLRVKAAVGPHSRLNWTWDTPLEEWDGLSSESYAESYDAAHFDPPLKFAVRRLNIYGGCFEGPIAPELGDLHNIEEITIQEACITGEIPPELGNLSKLRKLDLSHNGLTGEIPPELGNLRNLEKLILNSNLLVGQVPSELGNITNLDFLKLDGNWLVNREKLEGYARRIHWYPMRYQFTMEDNSAKEICAKDPECIWMTDLSWEQVSLLTMMDLDGSAEVDWRQGSVGACVTQETMKEYPNNQLLNDLQEKGLTEC